MTPALSPVQLQPQPIASTGTIAILVNSSDGFEDCWAPFFTLFDRFGGELRSLPIYLNTERREFAWPGLDVRTTCVWPPDEAVRPTWSECFRRAVESIPEPYILYFQEDYFLNCEIDTAATARAFAELQANPDVSVAYLFRVGPLYTRSCPYNDLLVQVVPPSRYLASTQCAIWRKTFLLSLLRDWENGWMFEIFGSLRARTLKEKFLAVRPEIADSSPVVDYIYTGVIKGKWRKDCIPLFQQHGIEVDFSRRGMYRESDTFKSKWEVALKLVGRPGDLLRSIYSVLTASSGPPEGHLP